MNFLGACKLSSGDSIRMKGTNEALRVVAIRVNRQNRTVEIHAISEADELRRLIHREVWSGSPATGLRAESPAP